MSTPYWGQLPGPKVSSKTTRRLSDDYSPTEQRASFDEPARPPPKSRSNRISVQTTNTDAPTESTLSPYASPTTSSFLGKGLAPRPPTLPYGQSQYPPELLDKRERRRSHRSSNEEAEDLGPAPPAAPEVPRAPPVSYRHPYGNGGLPYTVPADGASRPPPSRRPGQQPPPDVMESNGNGSAADDYPREDTGSDRRHNPEPPVLDRSQKSLDRSNPSTRSRTGAGQSSSRRASGSGGGSQSGSRRPITKEEKRARVEAAEQNAKARAAAARDVDPAAASPQQVRFRQNQNEEEEVPPPKKIVSGARTPATAAAATTAAAAASVDARKGPLSQNPPEEGRRYGSGSQRAAAVAPDARKAVGTQTEVPKRNLSFRERAAKNDLKLPNGLEPDPRVEPKPPPVTSPSGGGISLTRSGSNKLRKEPPGDPWYSRRAEAERRYPSVAKRSPPEEEMLMMSGAAPPRSVSGAGRNKALPPDPPPATGNMNKAAKILGPEALAGQAKGSPDVPVRRAAKENYEDNRGSHGVLPGGRSPASAAAAAAAAASAGAVAATGANRRQRDHDDSLSDSSGWGREEDHKHRISKRLYKAHDTLRPGEGMYQPPRYLDEWKKGTVGTLAGALLDLSEDGKMPSVGTEKDKAWWEGTGRRRSSASRPRKAEAFEGEYDETNAPTRFKPHLFLECGPLLRYCGMRHEKIPTRSARNGAVSERVIWRGTVMIVTRDTESSYEIAPTLRLFVQPIELLPPPPAEIHGEEPLPPEYVDPIAGHPKLGRKGETFYVRPVEHLEEEMDLSVKPIDEGLFEKTRSLPDAAHTGGPATDYPGSFTSRRKRIAIDGEKVQKYKDVRGFRLHAERGCTFWRFNIEVELRERQQRIAYRINRGPSMGFWVPARDASMNVMFYSCNGFSRSVDPNTLSGPDPMWRDVLNTHQSQPFHVMLGGGDQIYNDVVADECDLFHEWLMIKNPLQKHNMPFTHEMQDEIESFYLRRYCRWFSQGLFGLASSQIPMVNMLDDHDIFDGYGSYPHHTMNSPVFCGLGAVAFKYYMLFQHQSVPDETEQSEPSWILGENPGPYIPEVSRSLFMNLGARMALVAVDARTERTESDVLRKATWSKVLDRIYAEIVKGKCDHLLVLLGVPIAYPRLVWLENILTSRLLDPVKALGKLGLLGNSLNHLDGGVEVLDDLNDHWTARNHKHERQIIIEDLQDFAAERSVRVTILSGDVHLAAVGQFFSNPKLGIPKHKDFRYMPNVISSAIVNTPPSDLLADVLNKRNKVHHFDSTTDENMIPMFNTGVEGKPRNNKHLLPHRNWCSIREWAPGNTPPGTPEPQHERSPSPPPRRGGSLLRRLSRTRGPSYRPDGAPREREPRGETRPPISGSGGLFRAFSRSRRSSAESERPGTGQTAPKRTLSLTRADFNPRRLFSRRGSRSRPDDGGINGNWGEDSGTEDDDGYFDDPRRYGDRDYHAHGHEREEQRRQQQQQQQQHYSPGRQQSAPRQDQMYLRGGGTHDDEYEEGDDSYFTARPQATRRHVPPPQPPQQQYQQDDVRRYHGGGGHHDVETPPASAPVPAQPPTRPFHRTPTGLSVKQMKRAHEHEVDLEGGLDICLNVEVSAKDPSGITVPYRLLVPRLFYEYQGEDALGGSGTAHKEQGGFRRFVSFRKRAPIAQEYDSEEDEELRAEELSDAGVGR